MALFYQFLKHTSDTYQLEMLVLFLEILILKSLASDWSLFYLIVSYDVNQNFDNNSNVVFLKNMTV